MRNRTLIVAVAFTGLLLLALLGALGDLAHGRRPTLAHA
jgi:hypothetical protein